MAAANSVSTTSTGWGPMGYLQWEPHTAHPACQMGVGIANGAPAPVFGTGEIDGKQTNQYVATVGGTPSIPEGSVLVGATLSGAVVAANVGGDVAPAGPTDFLVGIGMGAEYGFAFCPQLSPSLTVTVNLPGNSTQPVAFVVDAFAFLKQVIADWGGAGGSLAYAGGPWLSPAGALTFTAHYAYVPTGLVANALAVGNGTEALLTWNPAGNDDSTPYALQRATVTASGAVGAWSTIHQGRATTFVTTDQRCGVGYVYRVAAGGTDVATPWDASEEWDEYPCDLSVVAAAETALTLSWPEVTPETHPVLVWCAEATPAGGQSCAQRAVDLAPGTTLATISGLRPNTEYALWACSVSDAWGCPEVNVWTGAAPPADLTASTVAAGIGSDDQPLEWSAGANPAGTVYLLEQTVLAPDGQAASQTIVYRGAATAFTASQSIATSYLYRVSAIAVGSGAPGPTSAAVPVQVAGPPTVAAQGPHTLRVSWPAVVAVHETWVGCGSVSGAMTAAQGQLAEDTLTVTVSGLRPNTPYRCAVAAVASNAGIAWRQQASAIYTDAAQPLAQPLDDISQTALGVAWGAADNPPGTAYQIIVQAGAGGATVATGTSTANAYLVSGLAPGTVYAAAVRARNGAGVWTAWTALGAAPTVPATPVVSGTAGGLGWSATGGRGFVRLKWAPVTGATGYRVWVFDGAQYESFGVGGATTWDSTAALIYPPNAALYPNVAAGTAVPPIFAHDAGGLNLRDRPGDLYCSVSATDCGEGITTPQNYWFSVSAYDASGDSASFVPPGRALSSDYAPTLPAQTDPGVPNIVEFALRSGNDNGYAFGPAIGFALDATESPAGVAAYALSNDGSTWKLIPVAGCAVGQVAACAATLDAHGTWDVSAGPGTKTVYARVESTAGVWSPPVMSTVYVEPDTQPPTVDVTINGGAGRTTATAVHVQTHVTDPLAGQADLAFSARYSVDGGQTWSAWQSEGTVRTWSQSVAVPGGASGERTVLEQVEDSDMNLGQGGATIVYVASAAAAPGAADASSGVPCLWPLGKSDASALCVRVDQVSVPMSASAGAVQMRASLDGVLWGPWEPVVSSLPVDLGAAPGPKTLWVDYRNAAGTVTALPPRYYVYDPAAPTLSVAWVGDASATAGDGMATLQLGASDDVGPTSSLKLAVTSDGQTLYAGAYAPDVPVTLSGAGYQIVTVTVTDMAGNTASQELGIFVE